MAALLLVDFEEMNDRCEKAVRLTRRARQLDSRNAHRAGEAAARVLGQAISDMWESRRQYSDSPSHAASTGRTWLPPLG